LHFIGSVDATRESPAPGVLSYMPSQH
jgi:hypothetical protein